MLVLVWSACCSELLGLIGGGYHMFWSALSLTMLRRRCCCFCCCRRAWPAASTASVTPATTLPATWRGDPLVAAQVRARSSRALGGVGGGRGELSLLPVSPCCPLCCIYQPHSTPHPPLTVSLPACSPARLSPLPTATPLCRQTRPQQQRRACGSAPPDPPAPDSRQRRAVAHRAGCVRTPA